MCVCARMYVYACVCAYVCASVCVGMCVCACGVGLKRETGNKETETGNGNVVKKST